MKYSINQTHRRWGRLLRLESSLGKKKKSSKCIIVFRETFDDCSHQLTRSITQVRPWLGYLSAQVYGWLFLMAYRNKSGRIGHGSWHEFGGKRFRVLDVGCLTVDTIPLLRLPSRDRRAW
jgi:hypothetical protein